MLFVLIKVPRLMRGDFLATLEALGMFEGENRFTKGSSKYPSETADILQERASSFVFLTTSIIKEIKKLLKIEMRNC